MSDTVDLEAVVARALDARLESFKDPSREVGKWVRVLIGGAFALGVWVATLQLSVTQAVSDVRRIDGELRESRMQIQTLSSDMAVTKAAAIRIEEDMKEVKADIKAWTGR